MKLPLAAPTETDEEEMIRIRIRMSTDRDRETERQRERDSERERPRCCVLRISISSLLNNVRKTISLRGTPQRAQKHNNHTSG
jgi:hypothetical protein